jgi:AAA15 family ATPase/GTPase
VENNHLTYFKIENFKKFEYLEVNDIGQFNLIVGDNNVGKTCLLEALLFDEDKFQLLSNFHLALTKRGLKFQIEEITKKVGNLVTIENLYPKENYFEEYIFGKFSDKITFNYTINSKNKNVLLKINPKKNVSKYLNGFEINSNIKIEDYVKQFICYQTDSIEEDVVTYWIYDYDENILNFPLISFNSTPIKEEARLIYENLKTKREKEILIDVLKVVNPNIVNIELRENFEDLKSVFLISFEDKDEFVPLNFLGDGFKRIFYIVLKALSLRGKRILIDEIEIGIHYSKMKDFWVNIMKVCKELDVQLFATTHSQECTETYIEASNVLNYNNEIRLIKLEESSNKDKIYASTFTYNQISAGLDSNVELRG